MRKIFILLNFIGLLFSVTQTSVKAKADLAVPVEIIGVRDLGLSERDESRTVFEVSWRVGERIQEEKIAAFILVLNVTYADGTIIVEKRKFERTVFSARVEVPSVKSLGRRSSAFIKKTEARVSAAIFKN